MELEQLPRSYTLEFQKNDTLKVLSINELDSQDFLDTVLPCIIDMYKRGFCLIDAKQEENK